MFRGSVLAGVSVLAMAVAMPAMSATITVDKVSFSDGSRQIVVRDTDPLTRDRAVNAGRIELRKLDATTLLLWCVDIFNDLSTGTQRPPVVYETGILTDDSGTPPVLLSAAQLERVSGLANAGDAALASDPGNAVVSAAYQAAIWETLYPTWEFFSRNATVQALITTLNGTAFSGGQGTTYTPLDKDGEKDGQTLFAGGPEPINPVPVPGALGLFGFALAGLVLARRKAA
jgi:hypothetical protein